MRISDWSSDVCSSDLFRQLRLVRAAQRCRNRRQVDTGAWILCKRGAAAAGHFKNQFFRLFFVHVWIALRLTALRRTEEHTSELQSLMRISYAVFCLKKKNKQTQ